MKLEFLGAAHEVTGSCHFLQVGDKNILIDCGMEQGPDIYENQELPVNAAAERLLAVAKKCEGRPNKELGQFADQINSLCDKWEK